MDRAGAVHFFLSLCSIVLIDLMLAGDNALVIAMAVRCLPKDQRRIGSICGAAAAVVLSVALTFIAAQLLNIQFLKLAGGLLVLWIAVKVLLDASGPPEENTSPRRFIEAIWYITFADITMSTDNVLAIAGASQGSFGLILFGLAFSIPFVVLSSNLLAALMDRLPWLVYLGAAVLGKVAGDMVLTDPFVVQALHPSAAVHYGIDAALALILFLAGFVMARRRE